MNFNNPKNDYLTASSSTISGAATSRPANPAMTQPSTSTSVPTPTSPTASAVPPSTTTFVSPRLNPRSCVTCRRRKVRCNKESPCANCVRAGIDCIFPGPGRAPRKSRKPPDAELLARLRKLEGVVQTLGAHVEDNNNNMVGSVSGVAPTGRGPGSPASGALGLAGIGRFAESPGSDRSDTGQGGKRASIDRQLGRLVVSEDRSRYVSNAFWTAMSDEIAEMRDLLDASTTDEEEEELSPDSEFQSSHQSFIFGYASTMVDLRALHPTPSQTFILWEIFKENVDPMVRILHRPVARTILMNAASNLDRVSKPAEALLFAIYLGAVVSSTPEQCQQLLDDSRESLIKRYRFATEQALARADLLNTNSLMCMQAFCLFLIFVRHSDDTRVVWSLAGLAIHLAQALGIHRDGSQFGLNPFDTEMRRRLWWHLTLIDNRTAEDHGTDPIFSEQFYDTKIPLNVNDDDIWPGMQEAPKERQGATEMTFCIVRFELNVLSRRLNFADPSFGHYRNFVEWSQEEKERSIEEVHRKLDEKYLRYADMERPIDWVTATVSKSIMTKMWLMIHHPRSSEPNPNHTLSPDLREQIFVKSIELIESISLLENNEKTSHWAWVFKAYMQWQSVAFVLSELCVHPQGDNVERAWSAVESVYNERMVKNLTQKGMLWKPIRQLMVRAKKLRGRQLTKYTTGSQAHVNKDMLFTDLSSTTPMQRFIQDYPNNVLSSTLEAFDMDLEDPTALSTSNATMVRDSASNMNTTTNTNFAIGSLDQTNASNLFSVSDELSPSDANLGFQENEGFNFGWTPTLGEFGDAREPFQRYFMNTAKQWF